MCKFVTEANYGEVDFRSRVALRRSLQNPHSERTEFAELGHEAWLSGWPIEDSEGLVDISAGKAVRWVHGEGWIAGHE